MSIFEVTSNKAILEKCDLFDLNLDNQSKRVFEITVETVLLEKKECTMLLLHEQTAQYKLQKYREQTAGMAFANKCISNQIMEPLNTINSYADILNRKLEQRPEIV